MNSTMKAVLCFVIFSVSYAAGDMAGECAMAGFYLELGCTPSAGNNSLCPDSFTCPDLHPDKTMCYYRGIAYGDRAAVPQNVILNPCSQACSCRVQPGGGARFDCAAVDCFETFDENMRECIKTFELDSCCSTNTVCGKDDIASLKTCEVDGETYYEGQQFEPQKTRKSCICTAEWTGKADNYTYCKDLNCGLEIHYQDKILDNCAPIFAGASDRTCPIGFQCPSAKTKVVRGLNIRNINIQCVFGNETLTIGDEVTSDEKCVKCACKVPPFVTCSRKNICDE